MNILITGAGGFIGKNLICALENIRDGKDRSHPELSIGEIFRCTRQTTEAEIFSRSRETPTIQKPRMDRLLFHGILTRDGNYFYSKVLWEPLPLGNMWVQLR